MSSLLNSVAHKTSEKPFPTPLFNGETFRFAD
jgi:hypothetical protein